MKESKNKRNKQKQTNQINKWEKGGKKEENCSAPPAQEMMWVPRISQRDNNIPLLMQLAVH